MFKPDEMLPDWMIEDLLRKEREAEIERENRPSLRLPLPQPMMPVERPEEPKSDRGVCIIPL